MLALRALAGGRLATLGATWRFTTGCSEPMLREMIWCLVGAGTRGKLSAVAAGIVLLAGVGSADAQLLPGFDFDSRQFRIEQVGDDHFRLIGEVEIDGEGYQFFADQVDLYPKETLLVAEGNVVYVGDGGRVAAERAEFDTEALTATFYDATAGVRLGDGEVERSMFGNHEPDMQFYGETIEKLGPRTYRLSKGGFTSCLQPTPRWQMTATSITLNLESYALLRNSVLKVKGVPLFYLPAMYFPVQEDDRATGMLMPTYGASTAHGQSLSNAFFWALGRSHDATFYHDWFTQTGQGTGAEYRYVLGPSSEGQLRTYWLDERATTQNVGGFEREYPARRSYELRGDARYNVTDNISARGQVNYFSDVTVQQQYQSNIFDASNSRRNMSGNVAGNWGLYQVSGTYDLNETFFGAQRSTRHGAGPRIKFDQSQRELPFTPFYFSFESEFANLLQRSTSTTGRPVSDGGFGVIERIEDAGLNRFEVAPVLQIPFTRWPFLTVDSTVTWRGTFWTESLNLGEQVDDGVSRGYYEFRSELTGPSFVKVWDTPDSAFSERMKHVIEPWMAVERITAVDNFERIVQIEGNDSVLGNVTQFRYGINNRLYAKEPQADGNGLAREILSVQVTQSYYTDARAAQYDRRFRTSFNRTPPSNFSPVSVIARATLTEGLGGAFRTEYDTQFGAFRTVSAEGTFGFRGWAQADAGWSQRRFVPGLSGFDDPDRLDHYLNFSASARTRSNNVGGAYSFHYDVQRGRYLQQRMLVYYNAQCCGVSGEYEVFNFQGLGSRARIPQDRRFHLSFTLAGLGTFANVLGAFGLGQGTDRNARY